MSLQQFEFRTTPVSSDCPRIKTRTRTMAMSSLRPGDVLSIGLDLDLIVLAHSLKHRKILIRYFYDGTERLYNYGDFSSELIYLGPGRPRNWWVWLPKFLRKHICPYGPPSK